MGDHQSRRIAGFPETAKIERSPNPSMARVRVGFHRWSLMDAARLCRSANTLLGVGNEGEEDEGKDKDA
jgi:hypothetical protein